MPNSHGLIYFQICGVRYVVIVVVVVTDPAQKYKNVFKSMTVSQEYFPDSTVVSILSGLNPLWD